MPKISLIVAYTIPNRVIGVKNTLPWRLPSDLAHFKKHTLGCPIIMGRNTWESLGRPLPGRKNIVITRDQNYQAVGATVVHSIQGAIASCATAPQVFIIGGAQIYTQSLSLADEIIATEIDANLAGDAFFPAIDVTDWLITERSDIHHENQLNFQFITYNRRDIKS